MDNLGLGKYSPLLDIELIGESNSMVGLRCMDWDWSNYMLIGHIDDSSLRSFSSDIYNLFRIIISAYNHTVDNNKWNHWLLNSVIN